MCRQMSVNRPNAWIQKELCYSFKSSHSWQFAKCRKLVSLRWNSCLENVMVFALPKPLFSDFFLVFDELRRYQNLWGKQKLTGCPFEITWKSLEKIRLYFSASTVREMCIFLKHHLRELYCPLSVNETACESREWCGQEKHVLSPVSFFAAFYYHLDYALVVWGLCTLRAVVIAFALAGVGLATMTCQFK